MTSPSLPAQSPSPRPSSTNPSSTPVVAPPRSGRRAGGLAFALFLLGSITAACTDASSEGEGSTEFETAAPTTTTDGDETDDETADVEGGDGGASSEGEGDEGDEAEPAAELPAPAWDELALELEPMTELEVPISLAARSGSQDLYIAQRGGVIRRVVRQFTDRGIERIDLSNRAMLDLTGQVSLDGERGLLDLAFSTDSRYLYVSYTDLDGATVIAEYDVNRSEVADVESRRELLRIPQPYANHNGGDIDLGPDGYLYVALGDGGSSNDPDGNGQNPDTLLGSVLRIDPYGIGDEAYSIPPGNPFAAGSPGEGEGRPEIWLTGVRNPWRMSFDSLTGDLWIADVGQDAYEEVNVLRAGSDEGGFGANLGWPAMEGFSETGNGSVPGDAVAPIAVYPHGDGNCSVTGGFVYRGVLNPLLDGVYLFGDYCSGTLWGLHQVEGQTQVWPLSTSAAPGELVSIDEGPDGEAYIVQAGGVVARLEPREAEPEG